MNILQRMKQERPYLQLLSCKENIIIISLSVIVFLSVLRHADINRTTAKLLTTALPYQQSADITRRHRSAI